MIAWLRKELLEHWLALLGWAALGVVLYGAFLVNAAVKAGMGSWFEALTLFTMAWTVLGTGYLAGRLVRREYASRTQLFLESLPVSRAAALSVKLALGAALVVASMVAAVGLAWILAARVEHPSLWRVAFIAVRVTSFALLGWSAFAMAALLGRYRVPLVVVLGIALVVLDSFTAFDVTSAGPARLLGQDLPFEGSKLPWDALGITWAIVAALTAISYALVLARDGTLTTQFSDRMSHREKVFVGCVFIGLAFGVSVLESSKPKQEFRLEDAVEADSGQTRVEVAPTTTDPELERALATKLADAIEASRAELQLPEPAAVAVIPTAELDPDLQERGTVSGARGLVFRANVEDPRAEIPELLGYAIHEVISQASAGRAGDEPRHWVLDAYETVFSRRRLEPDAEARIWLRAAYAGGEHPDLPELLRWDESQERLGRCLSGAYAASALMTLEERAGKERTLRFLRAAFARPSGLGWIPGVRPGIPELLATEAGLSQPELITAWQQRLAAVRRDRSAELARIPRMAPAVTVAPLSSATFQGRHALALTPPPADPVHYMFRYAKLGAFDGPISPSDLELQEALANASEPAQIPRPFMRGDRWFWAFEIRSDVLGCTIRLGTERRDIP